METLSVSGRELLRHSLETFLRGMETERQTGAVHVVAKPLKPSLEGWKPSSSSGRRPRLLALKPSLEGWKPGLECDTFHREPPLKPSLEGWKPHNQYGTDEPLSGLETFLRGMETPGDGDLRHAGGRLETFLRGMETRSLDEKYEDDELPLKPSLEGWKPKIGTARLSCLRSLETFLRGMETLGPGLLCTS